jgi:hypothetical protein
MLLRKKNLLALSIVALWAAPQVQATVTINVTTNNDEKNCYSGSGSGACLNNGPNPFPNSTGCSLREAISVIDSGNNTSFPECTPAPETGAAANNIIDLGGRTVVLNKGVPDPTKPASPAMTAYMGTMPDIFGSSSIGKMTIQNGVVQCFADPISGTGVRMFHVVGGVSPDRLGPGRQLIVALDGPGRGTLEDEAYRLEIHDVTVDGAAQIRLLQALPEGPALSDPPASRETMVKAVRRALGGD